MIGIVTIAAAAAGLYAAGIYVAAQIMMREQRRISDREAELAREQITVEWHYYPNSPLRYGCALRWMEVPSDQTVRTDPATGWQLATLHSIEGFGVGPSPSDAIENALRNLISNTVRARSQLHALEVQARATEHERELPIEMV